MTLLLPIRTKDAEDANQVLYAMALWGASVREREASVIRRRCEAFIHGRKDTYRSIASDMGVTPARVQQLERQGMRRLLSAMIRAFEDAEELSVK